MNNMHSLSRLACWLALSVPFLADVAAADRAGSGAAARSDSGTVSGRVQHQVTGLYLINARVTVPGTVLLTLTDEAGAFRLAGVPSGRVELEVYYSGLDVQRVTVEVPAGQTVHRDVALTSTARYGADATVKLDSFVVSTARETDAAIIATNERRFAGNPKDVVSTDAFGDITGGNIGEFMKYLPGVLPVDGGGSEVNNISLRGLPANLTVFTTDGLPLASANTAGDSRTADVTSVMMTNVSRVEIIKLPLPSTRADSMAGTVNLVTKTAFERSSAEFRYRAHVTANAQYLSLNRTPYIFENRAYTTYPGFDFDYTNPLTKRLGIAISGLHSRILTPSHALFRDYTATGANTGASFSRPAFIEIINRSPSFAVAQRDSLGLKVDWRIMPHAVLSAGLQTSYNETEAQNNQFRQGTGTNGAPTVVTGVRFTYGPDFTSGATGRGSATLPSTLQSTSSAATAGNLAFKFNDGTWKLDAGLSRSAARKWMRQTERGFFNGITVGLKVPVRLVFSDIENDRMNLRAFDNSEREVDVYNIDNYAITAAATAPRDIRDQVLASNLDLRRQFGAMRFPLAFQVGGSFHEQERDSQRRPAAFTYRPPGGDNSAAPYAARIFRPEVNGEPGRYYNQGDKLGPTVSPLLAYRAWLANPDLFYQTPAQVLATEQNYRVNSFNIREAVSAAYGQADARFFRDRLNVVTGVRFEQTRNRGRGVLQDPSAVFLRNSDGSFARSPAGARIRRSDAGAVGSIEEMRLIYQRRGYAAERTTDGYFPSLHLRWNATENVIARASYAKTYGRPDFSNIIPNTVTNEADVSDPSQVQGTLTASNPGLRPWYADSFDLSLEYYTPQGGIVSAGVYLKEIKDFFGTFAKVASIADLQALGFDPAYENWLITTKINAGNARISGVEFSVNQSLAFLGGWGRYVRVFVNGTKLKLESDSNLADFGYFLPESANWGFTVARKPFTFRANWNYRGWLKAAPIPTRGPDGYGYLKPAGPNLDASLEFQVGRTTSLFVNAKNVFNTPVYHDYWGSETPDYARRASTQNFGTILTAGVRGKF